MLAFHHAAGNRAVGTLLQRKPRRGKKPRPLDQKAAERIMWRIMEIINKTHGDDDPSRWPDEAVPAGERELLALWYELTYGKTSDGKRIALEREEFLSKYAVATAQTEPILRMVAQGRLKKVLLESWMPRRTEFEIRKDSAQRILELDKTTLPPFWMYATPYPISLGEFLDIVTRQDSRVVPLQRGGGIQVGTVQVGEIYYASQQEPRLVLWSGHTGVVFAVGEQIFQQSLDSFSEDVILGAIIKAAQDVGPFVEFMTFVIDMAISLTPVGAVYDLTLAAKSAADGKWGDAALQLLPGVPFGRLAKATRLGRAAFKVGSKGAAAIERAFAGAAAFAGRGFRKIGGKMRRGLWLVTEGASEAAGKTGGKEVFYFLDEAENVWRKVPDDEAALFIKCTQCAMTGAGKGSETVAEFEARGGKVTQLPAGPTPAKGPTQFEDVAGGVERAPEGTVEIPRHTGVVRTSEQAGREGGLHAAQRDGIAVDAWDNPQSHIPEFGRGLDGVGTQGRKKVILEFKGESSQLAADQMSDAWVGRKLAELEYLGDPKAQELLRAARNGLLEGRTYRTRIVNKELESALDGPVVNYNARKIEQAYQRRLKELRN